MSTHHPDKWEIVKYKSEEGTWYKVLGGWSGGYLDGDSWRLSSGIISITIEGKYYMITNESGSIYKCHKEGRGMTHLMGSMYSTIKEYAEKSKIVVSTIDVKDFLESK